MTGKGIIDQGRCLNPSIGSILQKKATERGGKPARAEKLGAKNCEGG